MEPSAKKQLLDHNAAGAQVPGDQAILHTEPDGTVTIKAYTSTEVNDAWAKAFLMHGIPYAFYDSPHFRKALEMSTKCPDLKLVNSSTLSDTHVGNVYQDAKDRTFDHVAGELKTYGSCGMSDGAKATGGVPFVNYLAGVPSGVYYVEAVDTTGITKDMEYLTKEHARIAKKLGTMAGLGETIEHQDFIVVDGACASIESFLEEEMPTTTLGICVPHSGDRIVDDIFHKGERSITIGNKRVKYTGCGEWSLPLKKHSDEIIDFIWVCAIFCCVHVSICCSVIHQILVWCRAMIRLEPCS